MFTDPLAVTYNSTAKSLPRVASTSTGTVYRTADGEFEVRISGSTKPAGDGTFFRSIELVRRIPDATPSDAFDAYREIRNAFKLSYRFDTSRAESSIDIPRLRTALLALVDSAFESRLISGEK